jgi:hypothetical protein
MDVSYPTILIGTHPWDAEVKKAHMMAYEKQVKDYNDVRRGSNPLMRGYEEVVPHHIYLYIHYYDYIIKRSLFFASK